MKAGTPVSNKYNYEIICKNFAISEEVNNC